MKLLILFVGAALIGVINGQEIVKVPSEYEGIEKHILEKIIKPEDGEVERSIKSLFAQYILLAAMGARNGSAVTPTRVESRPQAQVVQQPLPPQVIYVYITPPTTEVPTRRDNERTRKPKPPKPPKTKKPKPPRAPHPDRLEQQQAQPQYQQQYLQQQQAQPQIPQYQQQQNQISQFQQQPIIQQAPQAEVAVPPQVSATNVPILAPSPTMLPAAPPSPPFMFPTLRPRPSTEHVLNQVDKILVNVGKGNITGIVDQSLQIHHPPAVQNLVGGILNTIFCTPINRLFGRCRGRQLIQYY